MNLIKPNKDYVFVLIQLIIFVAYILPFQLFLINLPKWLCYSGLVLFGDSVLFGIAAILQLNTDLSPFASPVISGRLITTGAFRMSRHPIYTALIFSGLGYAIYSSSRYKVLITLILWVLFYYKLVYEEKLLSQKFKEYNIIKREHAALFKNSCRTIEKSL